MPSNHQVMYHLQDALSLVPDLIPLTKSFHIETHDQEMVGNVIFCYFLIQSLLKFMSRRFSNISKPRKVTSSLFGQFSQIYRRPSRFNQQQNSKLDAARKSRAEKDRRNRKASSGGEVRAPKIFFFSRHSSLRCNLCASRSFCLHIHVPFFCSARNTTINKFDLIDN